jgi:ATP-dependent Clp protease protease subunit
VSSYLVPSVIESTPKGERVSDIFSRLLSERIVFVGTPIDDGVANVVIAQLLHLAADSPKEIHLYLNSPGGSFSSVMAIYDTMQFVACDVATLCVGQATASSAILLAAGSPGRRSVLPHARIVLHQPHADGSRGSLSDLALEAAELARVRAQGEALLARHTGRPVEQIRHDTDRALVLTGEQAVEYGIVDQVLASADAGGSGGHAEHATALRPDS